MPKKKWRISEKQLEAINDLIIKAHKVRRKLTHKSDPDSSFRIHNIPDQVIPKRERRKNYNSFSSYEQYRKELKRLKGLYDEGMITYYREEYKKNYLNSLLDMLNSESSIFGDVIEPNTWNGYFSKEQIEYYKDTQLGDFMSWYNKVKAMSVSKFMQMYERGYIVYLRYLYRDMIDYSGESDFLAEQLDLYSTFNRIMVKHSNKTSKSGGTYSKTKMRTTK